MTLVLLIRKREDFFEIPTAVAQTLLNVLAPIMLLFEPQDLSNLPITQGGLPVAHFPRNRRLGTHSLQKRFRLAVPLRPRPRHRVPISTSPYGNTIICAVEDLEAKHRRVVDGQMGDLAEVAGVDVGPGVALAGWGVG